MQDLIAAPATPAGPAERSTIRISGEGLIDLLHHSFRCDNINWRHSHASRRHPGHFQIEGWRVPVPIDLWLWPTKRSYTGQPSAELHFVGSPPIVDAILQQLFRDGARPARAGEFTLRAFLAGRLDLTQAEAVLGVIDATDDAQLRTALTQLAGGLSQKIGHIRESLLIDLADLEAGLDFVEEDIEFVHRGQMRKRIQDALAFVQELLKQCTSRMVSSTCPKVVLAGLPNAGKSTLFNHLAGEHKAIVSDQAGTTRDYLSARLEWDHLPLELIDTAGVDHAATDIAGLAEQLRMKVVHQADLVIWCSSVMATDLVRAQDDSLFAEATRQQLPLMRVGTQCDRLSENSPRPICDRFVSARTGQGIGILKFVITRRLAERPLHQEEWMTSTAARSQESLERCLDGISAAIKACDAHWGDELLSLELRVALEALGEICGQVHTDDVLDRIFSRFCIGK